MTQPKRFPIVLLLASTLFASGPLGFVEQRFADLHFEKDKWTRVAQASCLVYTAKEDNATLELLGIGASGLVPFRAKKGLTVSVCGEVAALDEGFETGSPISTTLPAK